MKRPVKAFVLFDGSTRIHQSGVVPVQNIPLDFSFPVSFIAVYVEVVCFCSFVDTVLRKWNGEDGPLCLAINTLCGLLGYETNMRVNVVLPVTDFIFLLILGS